MYIVTKSAGYGQTVEVKDTDAKTNITVGTVSITMLRILSILEEAGYKTDDGTLVLTDEWNLEVNKETATKLAKLAMPMKKPIRNQKKKANEINRKAYNKKIDAMDVLLGLAQYN